MCKQILEHAVRLPLLIQVIAVCRELVKVAPPKLRPVCYAHSAEAMFGLQRLDEAEEMMHEGLAASEADGKWVVKVSRALRRS
jgi:hypothetical protein